MLAAALLLPGPAPASAGAEAAPADPLSRAGSTRGLTGGARPPDGPAAPAGTGMAGDTAGCELRLRPRRIAVQEAAVLVTVLASADPGALRGVEVAPRSRVTVLKAAPARDRGGVVARMALDSSGARPGRWQVVLRGGAADCRGTLAVTAGGGRRGS